MNVTSCGRQVGNPVDERGDDLLLRALADVRGADRGHFPVLFPALGDQRAYADDRVVDELGELVAHLRAHLIVRLADEPLGRREAAQVRNGLDVPDDDACGHC